MFLQNIHCTLLFHTNIFSERLGQKKTNLEKLLIKRCLMYILTNPEKSILGASAIYVVSLISTRQLTSECVMDTFF